MAAIPCIDFTGLADLAGVAAREAACLAEASDGFAALVEVAALSDGAMENSSIAKPIIAMKTSLVGRIMLFSQVEVVMAFPLKEK